MGILIYAIATQVGLGGGGGFGSFSLSSLGWTIMWWYNTLTWGPNILFWILHMIFRKSETIAYYFVTFSNLTMLGPIIVYWATLALVLLSWILSGFASVLKSLLYFFELLILYIFASYFQWQWIDEVRAIYTGDKNTL